MVIVLQRHLSEREYTHATASASPNPALQAEVHELATHVASVDGELGRIREMAEQLEACILDDLRDLGTRLEAAEAASVIRPAGQPSAASSAAGAADRPAQGADTIVRPGDGQLLSGPVEKRLRRVEVTMAGEIAQAACP